MNQHQPFFYSLWLMPAGEINYELVEMIFHLSRYYFAPVFPPHVTLLGNLTGSETELSTLTRQLAAQIRPFAVKLTTVDDLDEYFRCLFLRVEETHILLKANRAAQILFQRQQDPPFMPHLSLLYGNFDIETRQRIIASIGRDGNRSFSAREIHLYSTTGEPRDWYRVQTYPLQGS